MKHHCVRRLHGQRSGSLGASLKTLGSRLHGFCEAPSDGKIMSLGRTRCFHHLPTSKHSLQNLSYIFEHQAVVLQCERSQSQKSASCVLKHELMQTILEKSAVPASDLVIRSCKPPASWARRWWPPHVCYASFCKIKSISLNAMECSFG